MWDELKQIVFKNVMKKKVKKKKKKWIQLMGYQLFQEEERGEENVQEMEKWKRDGKKIFREEFRELLEKKQNEKREEEEEELKKLKREVNI